MALGLEVFELIHQLFGVPDHAAEVLVLVLLAVFEPLQVCLHRADVAPLIVDFTSGADVQLLRLLGLVILSTKFVDETLVLIPADLDLRLQSYVFVHRLDESDLDLADLFLETFLVPHVKLLGVLAGPRPATRTFLHDASLSHFEQFMTIIFK